MALSKIFLVNFSVMITFAYLTNLVYKNLINRMSFRMQYVFTVVVFVLTGWLTMFFSFNFGTDAPFDLRLVPLIFSTLVFSEPSTVAIIGIGTGLLRLTLGWDWSGWAAMITVSLTAVFAAGLTAWYLRRPGLGFWKKAVISVLAINAFRTVVVPLMGVVDPAFYWSHIAPVIFPVGTVVSFFFILVIRDFHLEQKRVDAITRMNRLLRTRTNDLNEAKQNLQQQAIQLKTASRHKSEFLANMSHELKTPLNTILLLSQLQDEEGTAEEDRIRYGKLIHQSGRDLLGLVDDILDLTKVESGKLDVAEEPVSLVDVCCTMDEQFRPLAENRSILYKVETQGQMPDWILTDPLRLNQILRNLLANAFKFTDQGSVTLVLSVEPTADGLEEAVFRVTDTGAGIDTDKRETIFEAFQQEDGSINRKYGGSGLGLTISRQLANLLGGRIEVDSEKGKGSSFTLRLPISSEEPFLLKQG